MLHIKRLIKCSGGKVPVILRILHQRSYCNVTCLMLSSLDLVGWELYCFAHTVFCSSPYNRSLSVFILLFYNVIFTCLYAV